MVVLFCPYDSEVSYCSNIIVLEDWPLLLSGILQILLKILDVSLYCFNPTLESSRWMDFVHLDKALFTISSFITSNNFLFPLPFRRKQTILIPICVPISVTKNNAEIYRNTKLSHKYQLPLLNTWHFRLQYNLSGSKLYWLSPLGDLFLYHLNIWPAFDSASPTKGLTNQMCSMILTNISPKAINWWVRMSPRMLFPL